LNASANQEASTLIDDLLKNYDVDARPVSNWSEPVNVYLELSLRQILFLDNVQQTMQTSLWISAYWTDINLRWKPEDYGGIGGLALTPSRIWTPDNVFFQVVAPSVDLLTLYRTNVLPDGRVFWSIPLILSSSCKLNLDQFPWDEQECHLKYGSWSQPGSRMDVFNYSSGVDLTDYHENGEWYLQGVDIKKRVESVSGSTETYPSINFTIRLKRKASYYVINFILPPGLVMLTMIMMYLVPPESGEKVSLSVTLLLSSTVLMMAVQGYLPVQSDTTPLLSEYTDFVLLITAII
ncbi:hypothetical protein CAPTEDRAFT_135521, partial [Capitella teleta]